jgi:uncharacterized protein
MKGCYVYLTDEETRVHFSSLVNGFRKTENPPVLAKYEGLGLPIIPSSERLNQQAANSAPVFDLKFAAGQFSDYQDAGTFDLVVLLNHLRAGKGCFVARVDGEAG